MNTYDEELQNDLEAGNTPKEDGLDVRAYREVFRVLRSGPNYELSPGFSKKVVNRILEQKQANQARDYFWFGVGIFFLIISSIATLIFFVEFQLDFGFLSGMSNYKGLALFGVVFIAFLNWLDKRLVRDKQVHY